MYFTFLTSSYCYFPFSFSPSLPFFFLFKASFTLSPDVSNSQPSSPRAFVRVKSPSPRLRNHLIHRQQRFEKPNPAIDTNRSNSVLQSEHFTSNHSRVRPKPPHHVRSDIGRHRYVSISPKKQSALNNSKVDKEVSSSSREGRSRARSFIGVLRSRSKSLSKVLRQKNHSEDIESKTSRPKITISDEWSPCKADFSDPLSSVLSRPVTLRWKPRSRSQSRMTKTDALNLRPSNSFHGKIDFKRICQLDFHPRASNE